VDSGIVASELDALRDILQGEFDFIIELLNGPIHTKNPST